uniref:BED-type domain-containing protein n=1 Tax=Aegilops tauschii subsp. strangulata TaxID=200361 RepID=A0A453NUJ9_AEGTS
MEGGKGNSGGNNGKGRPGTVIIPRRSLPGEQQGVISGNTPKNSVAPTDVSGVAGASMVSSSTLQEGTSTTVEQPKLTGSRRKRTSDVWENFKTELINGKWQAICNWCHKPYAGESTSGGV